MSKLSLKAPVLFFLFLSLYVGCTRDKTSAAYNKLVESELASGKRADSIFFGIYLGMPIKDFYVRCWDLNKKGLFTDGNSNTTVLYKLNHNELKASASMNFYPELSGNKISRMLVAFEYDGWAPWNKELFADSLLPDVLNLYKKWYSSGNPFMEMEDKDKVRKIYIKVDGNRRIIIGRTNDRIVSVDYTNLLTKKEFKK